MNRKKLTLTMSLLMSFSPILTSVPAYAQTNEEPQATISYIKDTTQTLDDNLDEVNIPDANLKSAILSSLGKSGDSIITKGDLRNLTSLVGFYRNITDLTGLEYCENLVYADLPRTIFQI